jgi:hypothetical protein
MTTRTDVHRPSALVTEDYEFAYAYDSQEPDVFTRQLLNQLIDKGWTFGPNESAGDCYHCGARLRYVAVLKHLPTHRLIQVGEQCLDNRFDLATPEFHRLRKAAELDRARHAIKNRRLAWFAVNEDRQVAFEWAKHMVEVEYAYGYEGMRHRFVSQVTRYGDVSDKFVRAIMRDMARSERIAEERAAREAREAETSSPVVEGRIVVVGEVLTTKWQENDYGGSLKMLVRDDRGFKVWGTVPASIDLVGDVGQQRGLGHGDRVRFTATVEASGDDKTFGFFKRPTKAELLDA